MKPQSFPATAICLEINKINFQGNIIPGTWYKNIKYQDSEDRKRTPKTDLAAINILADVIYWYRPIEVRDEKTGLVIGYRRKFWGKKLQRSYAQLADQFGLTKDQARRACLNLKRYKLIEIELKTVITEKGKFGNVMFISPNPKRIKSMTYFICTPMPLESDRVSDSNGIPYQIRIGYPMPLESDTYTETTNTEISSETSLQRFEDTSFCDNTSPESSKKPQKQQPQKQKKSQEKNTDEYSLLHPLRGITESGNKLWADFLLAAQKLYAEKYGFPFIPPQGDGEVQALRFFGSLPNNLDVIISAYKLFLNSTGVRVPGYYGTPRSHALWLFVGEKGDGQYWLNMAMKQQQAMSLPANYGAPDLSMTEEQQAEMMADWEKELAAIRKANELKAKRNAA